MKHLYYLVSICLLFSCKSRDSENIQLAAFEFIPFEKVTDLDSAIKETSGITKIDQTIWTLNDSGNPNDLFQFDMQGTILHQVEALGSTNTDWEDITSDSTHLYIGNFGNNLGQRKDLMIYALPIDSLTAESTEVDMQINFSYADQTEFPGSYDHNFDCEAMVSYEDSLYLFSKSWKDEICMIYRLPKTSGDFQLTAMDQFDSKGAITGAALSPRQDRLCLVGYNFTGGVFDPFVWIFSEYEGSDFFGGQKVRYNLDSKRQMEAVEWVSDSTLYITSEAENIGSPSLFKVQL